MSVFLASYNGTEVIYTVQGHFKLPQDFTLDQHLKSFFEDVITPQNDNISKAVVEINILNTMNVNTMINLILPCLMPSELDISQHPNFTGCRSEFDSDGICWRSTPSNHSIFAVCSSFPWMFDSYHKKEAYVAAKRHCNEDGTWDTDTFEPCGQFNVIHSILPDLGHIEYVWTGGYLLSLMSLIVGIAIFMCLNGNIFPATPRNLRSPQIKIYANLFATYILTSLLWILSSALALKECEKAGIACKFLFTLELYSILTNLHWMLIEGLHLVLAAFFDANINLKKFALIGWGCPAILTAYWTAVKSFTWGADSDVFIIAAQFSTQWFDFTVADDILHRSRRDAVRMLLSVLFVIRIIWMLIDELQSTKTAPCKTTKKLILMLISLVGVSYLTLSLKSEDETVKDVRAILQAILTSSQGFCLSLLHCFLNPNVKIPFRRHKRNVRNDIQMETVKNKRN